MTIVSDFQDGVTEALLYGQQIRIRYFNTVFGSNDYYDDNISLTMSGDDFWTSGVLLPLSNTRGSSDAILLEQGKVLTDDKKLYVEGSVSTSGLLRIGLGSNATGSPVPITGEYSIVSEGVKKWDVNATSVLKKVFIRRLPTGTLTGE